MEELYNHRLTRSDIVDLAKEDVDYILGHHQAGLYDANTDEVRFAFNDKKRKSRATLICHNHTTNEMEEIKTVYYQEPNKYKYNKTIHKAVLLHKLFNLDIPEMYKEVPTYKQFV